MSGVTRYAWTAVGMRPSDIEHGPALFIHERAYDRLRDQYDDARILLREAQTHLMAGDNSEWRKSVDTHLKLTDD